MKKIIKTCTIFAALFSLGSSLFASPFNSNLTAAEKEKLDKGEVVIKNIDYSKYMSLNPDINETAASIVSKVKGYNPKYLAEIIQVRDYKGNEDLPAKMESILNNIGDYAGIPYYSERNKKYYDLYSSAEILETIEMNDGGKKIKAVLQMAPFDTVYEDIDYYAERSNILESINVEKKSDSLLYSAYNTGKIKYDGITCVGEKKLNIYIYLFRYEDKWVIYGVGGVNAPHLPFLTDRIRTSFINRIKTFCNFVFTKI